MRSHSRPASPRNSQHDWQLCPARVHIYVSQTSVCSVGMSWRCVCADMCWRDGVWQAPSHHPAPPYALCDVTSDMSTNNIHLYVRSPPCDGCSHIRRDSVSELQHQWLAGQSHSLRRSDAGLPPGALSARHLNWNVPDTDENHCRVRLSCRAVCSHMCRWRWRLKLAMPPPLTHCIVSRPVRYVAQPSASTTSVCHTEFVQATAGRAVHGVHDQTGGVQEQDANGHCAPAVLLANGTVG